MKHKKTLLILLICICTLSISILIILAALGCFKNNTPLYGKFVYMNDDGSDAVIILNESTVYFQNINYHSMEEITATTLALQELNNKGKENTKEALDTLRNNYLEQINFKSYYDKKTIPIDETLYIEDEQQYYYYLYYPSIKDNGIEICVTLKNQCLSVGDMEFQYDN